MKTLQQAQDEFHAAVAEQLQVIAKSQGLSTSEAVRVILQRITSEGSQPPTVEAIAELQKHQGASEEDAVRALVVRNELQLLRREGMDTLAAIRALTNKVNCKGTAPKMDRAKRVMVDEAPVSYVVKRLKQFANMDNEPISVTVDENTANSHASVSRANLPISHTKTRNSSSSAAPPLQPVRRSKRKQAVASDAGTKVGVRKKRK